MNKGNRIFSGFLVLDAILILGILTVRCLKWTLVLKFSKVSDTLFKKMLDSSHEIELGLGGVKMQMVNV